MQIEPNNLKMLSSQRRSSVKELADKKIYEDKKRITMTVSEAGRLGGLSRASKYSAEELSEQARRGAVTIEKQRPGFHAEIARHRSTPKKINDNTEPFVQKNKNNKQEEI